MAILAILIALGVGVLSRYRASTNLRTAVDRLAVDLQSTTRQLARTSNCPHFGVTRMPAAMPVAGLPLTARILRKVTGRTLEVVQTYPIGDEAGATSTLSILNITLLPIIDYTPVAAQGVALEISQNVSGNITQVFCVPFQPDGTLWTDPAQVAGTKTGAFTVTNTYSKNLLEIAPTGNVKQTDNVP